MQAHLQCIRITSPVTEMGVFGFTPARSKHLTVGKIYTGWLVPISKSDKSSHFARGDYKFLAFNDMQMWDCYELNLFGPVPPQPAAGLTTTNVS